MTLNSFSKILFTFQISANWDTFYRLLINAKKYKHYRKSNKKSLENQSFENYRLKGTKGSYKVRLRTFKGDISIFNEIFWQKSYFIPNEFLNQPKVIVDLGGHVGFTSIYFSTRYPNAKFYSVEASKQNFNILKFNVQSFKNILPSNKAIYTDDGFISFDESGLSYNNKIGESGEQMEAISVNSLLNLYGIEKVDLMKIDIEGAEKDILQKNTEWLEKTNAIIIELHKPYSIEDLKRDLNPFHFKIILPSKENGLKNILAIKEQN